MRKVFTREFWNTPITELTGKDRGSAMLLFFGIFLLCVVIGGIAAWRLIY